MFERLGSLNQRRLTARIREVYKEEFDDWYEFTIHLAKAGMTRADVCKQFEILGIRISQSTLSKWITNRERIERRKRESENAA